MRPEFGDPNLPLPEASEKEWTKYKNDLNEYSDEIIDALKNLNVYGEGMWIEFTCTFRPEAMQYLNSTQV